MKIRTVLAGLAVATTLPLAGAPAAGAIPDDFDWANGFVPVDQATVVDLDTLVFAKGGLLTADGTDLCATDPGRYVTAEGWYPCFTGFEGTPGMRVPLNVPVLAPFSQATVVDPGTVTLIPGGVLAADGSDLCAADPGSIVFPDGRYPCFIGFEQVWVTNPAPQGLPVPQVTQVPVGGADTGVPADRAGEDGLLPGVAMAGAGALAALAALRRVRAHSR
jgi:hypothetical protein